MTKPFNKYIWDELRRGILRLWVLLVVLSALSYAGVVAFLKNKELASSLSVAAFTVQEALKAGDWPLAIGHLGALEEAGPVYDIRLGRSNDTNITGPFGQPAWGLGSVCKKTAAGSELSVHGCMRIFGRTESATIILFLFFASLLFAALYCYFRKEMLAFIGRIATELRQMSTLPNPNKASTCDLSHDDITEINDAKVFISGLLKEREESAQLLALNQLSAQVAHDIRSPLTALDSILADVSHIAEDKRLLLRRSISRIRDIANNLLEKRNDARGMTTPVVESTTRHSSVHLITSHLDAIVSEKRIQYTSHKDLDIDFPLTSAAYCAFAKIDPSDFKRVISNVLDNAVQATSENGSVTVSLETDESDIIITISDNGVGIPADVLPLLGQSGFSFGKTGGSGLGLYHAKFKVESWAGKLNIVSEQRKGTRVRITLPKENPPLWFLRQLEIPPKSKVVVLDDDETIHLTWQSRLNATTADEHPLCIVHFRDSATFISWWESAQRDLSSLFLFDQELIGSDKSGLDLIEELNLEGQAVLVTSHFEDQGIIDRCISSGVKLLPKGLANYVPIAIREPRYSAVLIDDDEVVRMNWAAAASRHGKQLRLFKSADSFLSSANRIPRTTPIYIDSNLGSGKRGEVEAEHIHALGFHNIHITTGFSATDLTKTPWIRSVRGKEFPWG